jgi:L-threonylcarbamoyladenylate synthase
VTGRSPVPTWRLDGEPSGSVDVLTECLGRGGLLVFPTESSYALGADPRNPRAVEAVYRIKSREAGKPLPVVVGVQRHLAHLGIDPNLPILSRLAACWPGAVTVILPRIEGAPPLPAVAEARSVAVRIPGPRAMRELLAELGPLTATSANVSGEPPVLDPVEAARLLVGKDDLMGKDDLTGEDGVGADGIVIDGGRLAGGPPSTLVAPEVDRRGELVGLRVLRQGRVAPRDLAVLLGVPVEPGGGSDAAG